ncbi:transcription factor cwo-like isoform X1 [Haliotis rubra]|uniref:transcription factor cwo-like isoform X1 n=1 Tax=Haliotis rubra TaxID=36100 RepID=UPI001EE594FE|nr:transcription factor cwo-like isoform X1 [Haliotis rubra]
MDSNDFEGSNGRGQDEGGIRSGRLDGSQDKGIVHDEESRHLNFNICGDDFETKTIHRNKTPRDPMSHRIIEKRRRDRMNNCLADLSRLIPASYMKQGQGRIEKTEIIEMAITLINTLTEKLEKAETSTALPTQSQSLNHCCVSQLSLGYQECKDEVMRYLVESEGMCASDSFCDRVMGHLTVAGEKLLTSVSRIPADEKPEIKTSDIRSNFPEGLFNQQGSGQSNHSDLQLRNLLTNNERIIDSDDGHRNNRSDACSHLSLSSLTKPYSRAEGHYSTNSSDGTSFTEFLRPDSEKGSSGSGGGGQGSIYKFKHNITQRFSQEKHVSHPSDTSSTCSSSREDAGKLQRRKISKGKTRSQGSRISPYPSSSELSSGNTSNGTSSYHGDVSAVRSDSSNTPPDQSLNVQSSSNVPLPGFVLHPAGTHYFPISIHPTSIPECFRKSKLSGGMGLFHPISIPVQFFGPYIAMGDDHSIDNSIQSGSSWEPTQLPLTYAKVPGHVNGNSVL